MELRLKRDEFLAELAPMQGVVERRTTIPVLSHLLLVARGDRVELSATDLDVSLTSSLGAEVAREGSLAVQAKKFTEIVRSLVAEEISLRLEDERSLVISAGRARFRIHGLPAADFPTLPVADGKISVEIPAAKLRRWIGKILFAVSSEESRFQLSGALVHLKKGSIELVATDGHRLALLEAQLPNSKDDDSVLVPRKALQELLRMEGDGTLVYRRGEHHVAFAVGPRQLTCRILDGAFPDYERVIARSNDRKVTCDRKALGEAIQRVALITGERARSVRLEIAGGEIAISAANPDLGEASESVACDLKGGALKIALNPDYLVQFLAAVETEKVLLELKDENSQCVGMPVATDTSEERYLCIIMPMRL